jgi:hypothetical protein
MVMGGLMAASNSLRRPGLELGPITTDVYYYARLELLSRQ